jgi:sulfatase modifying factor 1
MGIEWSMSSKRDTVRAMPRPDRSVTLPSVITLGSLLTLSIGVLGGCHAETSGVPVPLGAPPAGMSLIEGGRFQPGGEMSQNSWITVGSFFVDVTEVTVEAYAACVQTGRCDAQQVKGVTADGDKLLPNLACNYGAIGRERHPMNCVAWNEADGYCRAQGKRLPTYDEWEWAARSVAVLEHHPLATQGSSPWEGSESAFQPCWSGHEPRTGTCAVGSSPAGDPPGGGVKDLAGNVSEWTAAHQARPGTTPSASVAANLEIMQGVNWQDNGWYQGTAHPFPQSYRFASTGFRCAK